MSLRELRENYEKSFNNLAGKTVIEQSGQGHDNMELNQKKTKQIIFNFNRDKQFTTETELKREPLEIVNEVKLLGVIISNDLKWHKNTNYLTKKVNRKMRMLHIAAKFTRNREHLKHIYKTFIRSNLEFSSTVWHSSLSMADRQDLERVQKPAVKVILKKDYVSYEEALSDRVS